jgi:hypothetical protein
VFISATKNHYSLLMECQHIKYVGSYQQLQSIWF